MKKLKLFLLLMLISSASFAQHKVSGKVVTSDNGQPVSFASVLLKGSTKHITTTNDNGEYTLILPSLDGVLVISSVGYKDTEVPIGGKSIVDATVDPDVTTLDESIVVAYGTARKGDYTGSASVLKAEKMKDVPVVSFEQALAGSATGVQLGNSSGLPGSFPQIRIRGVGSMNAGNDPLYVIDGIPAISGDLSTSNTGTSAMNFLSTNDIESVTILKDAAASALYGSRAANGVVLITTKKGRSGKTKFSFKSDLSLSSFAYNNFPLASEDEMQMLHEESWRNYGQDNPSKWNNASYDFSLDKYVEAQVELYYPARKPGYGYVSWEDELFRTAVSQNYELSVSGGNEKTRFFTSAAYNKNESVSKGRFFDRISGTLNLDHKASKYLSLGATVQYSNTSQEGNQENAGYDNPWWAVKSFVTPRWPAYYPDGTYYDEEYDPLNRNYHNPLINMANQITSSEQTRILIKPWVEATLAEGLKAKSTFGYDGLYVLDKFGWLSKHANGQAYGDGYYSEREHTYLKMVSSTTLNYSKTIANDHNISAMIGWEAESQKNHHSRIGVIDLTAILSTTLGNRIREAYGNNDTNSLLSFISSLSYNYKSKYFLTGTFRRDGSSRLAPNHRWGDFWSISGSWRISGEPFMQDLKWVNNLRLKASYGTSGTLPSQWYYYQDLYDFGKYGDQGSYYIATPPNSELTWEKNASANIALEARLFDRVNFNADFYIKKTKDLLMNTSTAGISGYTNYLRNVGEMENKGLELDVNVDIIKKTDLTWSAGFNWTMNTNKITKMSYDGEFLTSGNNIRMAGHSYYQFYGREYVGVDPDTGRPMFYKNTKITNPDGSTSYDKTIVYDARSASQILLDGITGDPDGFGGITTSLRYKNLSVSMVFNYQYGHHVWDQTQDQLQSDGYRLYRNMSKEQLKRWQKPGDITNVPRREPYQAAGFYNSSRMALPGDFIRLKNMSISYNLPEKWIKKANLESVRVYTSGTNLFALSGLYFDPELANYGGYVNFQTPPLRTISFGIEITL